MEIPSEIDNNLATQPVQNVPVVIFLQSTNGPALGLPPVPPLAPLSDRDTSTTNASDLIGNFSNVAAGLDANATGTQSLTWIGTDGVNVGEDQLLYVTYVGDPANCTPQLAQPMLLQVAPGTEGQMLMCPKPGGTENFEENAPNLPAEEPSAPSEAVVEETPQRKKYIKKRKQPSATLTDDVNIETKFQVLEAMCPTPPRKCQHPKHYSEMGLYKCELCEKEYNKSAQFYGHLHAHTGERTWACEQCNKTFQSESRLRTHEKAHMTVRPHICGTCGLQFDRESQREYHERNVHLEEKAHVCQFCSKGFFRQSDLKTHLKIHLGIRKNTCEICGKQFQHISNLVRHRRTHTGVKPYVCKLCGARFTQTNSLRMHMDKIHPALGPEGVPTFECSKCGKSLSTMAILRKHKRLVHMEDPPLDEDTPKPMRARSYYCQICGDSFQFMSQLSQHELEQHKPSEIIDCKHCGQNFKSVKDFKYHSCGIPPSEDIDIDDPETTAEQAEQQPEQVEQPLENQVQPLENQQQPLEQQPIDNEQPLQINENPLEINEDGLQINEDGLELEQLVEFQQPSQSKKDQDMMISLQGLLDWNPTKIETPPEMPEMVIYIQAEGQTEPTAVKIKYDTMLPEITFNASEEGACPSDESQFSLLSAPPAEEVNNLFDKMEPPIRGHSKIEQPIREHSEQDQPIIDQSETNSKQPIIEDHSAELQPISDHIIGDPPIMDNNVENQPIIEHIKIEQPIIEHIEIKQPIIDHNVQEQSMIDGSTETQPIIDRSAEELVDSILEKPNKSHNKIMIGPVMQPAVLKEEKPKNTFTCDDCHRVFNKKSNYTQHLGTHNIDLKRYSCEHCGGVYAWKSSLNKHVQQTHNLAAQNTKFPCTILSCPRVMSTAIALQQHIRRDHNMERNHACTECPKQFFKKADLAVHLRVHSKEKPYMCGTCGKSFAHLSHILRHERIHNQVKPYTCDICLQSFTQSTTLIIHRRKHFGPKPMKQKGIRTVKKGGKVQRLKQEEQDPLSTVNFAAIM